MIELTPPDEEDQASLARMPVLVEFMGVQYQLGAMLFDPTEVSMPEIMMGLGQYLHAVGDSLQFRAEAGVELAALFADHEGDE